MIEEAYCSYEVCKLLKDNGFDTPCDWAYNNKEGLFEVRGNPNENIYCYKPTQQMAMRWMREDKNILLYLYPIIVLPVKDDYTFYWRWDGKKKIHCAPHIGDKHNYESYEEAVEAALKYCLENLI